MQKTYTETFTVRATDCDLHGRMRLDALFIAMQEGGERHAIALGAGYAAMQDRGLFFALARIHVSTLRAPRQGETIVHTTWPGEMNRFFCPRYHVFSLQDGTPLAAAGALWVMLDTRQRRIVRPQSDVNGHVNNTKYIAWLCDALGLEAFDGAYIGDLVAGYEKEIRGHDPLKLTLAHEGDSFSFQIASEAGEKHFVAGGMLRPEV